MQAIYAFFGGSALSSKLSEAEKRAIHYCELIQGKEYKQAYSEMRADTSLSVEDKKAIMSAVSTAALYFIKLEWTNHGVQKTFRHWSQHEKESYLKQAQAVADSLKGLSPHVSFGFGSVLGIVRDCDFIPHDDDMDLVIAFEQPMKFADAKALVKSHLESSGFVCHGENLSHFGVNTGKGRAVDVFVGFIEGDRVSWFPSARKNLNVVDVFPVVKAEMFGVELDIPKNPEAYLAATYGEDWWHPIVNFSHPWDAAQYRDFV